MRLQVFSVIAAAALLAGCETSAPPATPPVASRVTADTASVIVVVVITDTPAPAGTATSTDTATPLPTDTLAGTTTGATASATATRLFVAFATDTPAAQPRNTSAPPTATNTNRPATPANSPVPPTNTPRPPTSTPGNTPVRPTSTPVPPTPTPTNTSLPPSPTTAVATTGDIRVFLVGFDPAAGEQYEHIHLCNYDSKPINVTGWKVKSPATGDVYTFGNYVAQLSGGTCGPVQFTVNTHNTGFENAGKGIFSWGQPLAKEEWPNAGGTAEVYNAAGALVVRCTYNPTVVAAPGDAYCR